MSKVHWLIHLSGYLSFDCLYYMDPGTANQYPFLHYLMFSYDLLQVAFVAIGATMVGSISFIKKEGDYVRKGDEVDLHVLSLIVL